MNTPDQEDCAAQAWREVSGERPFLLRLARMQLSSPADAEDAVQEALLAGVTGWSGYQRTATVRSWLLGILRFKIIDAIRSRKAETQRYVADDDEMSFDLDALFTAEDAWHPAVFVDTVCGAVQTERRQLLDLVEICMNHLPQQTAQLFLMREYLGMDLPEIEQACTISGGNLRVLLYRARMRLRDCAVRGWGELN